MRKSVIGALVLGLVGLVGGGLWLVRRGTATAPLEEDSALFKAESQGAGRLIQMEPREPLRGVRWLQPLAGGFALCQVNTQSDRQLVALFQDGQPRALFSLPRPDGVSEGYFRQAEVRDALWVQDSLVLLLKAEGGRREAPLVMALDREGALRWVQRASGEHLALAEGALWIWGPASAQRLPLQPGKEGRGELPPAVIWPEEVPPPEAFLPTSTGFLLSHAKGLSAWRGEAGWSHTPAPPPSPLGFGEPKGTLLKAGGTLYWQPEPGALLRVSPEGQILGAESLPVTEGQAQDAALLRLLGRDGEGRLWFGLAAPLLPAGVTPPPAPGPAREAAAPEGPADEGWKEEAPVAEPAAPAATPLTPEMREAYEALIRRPMDRLYAWKPGEKALRAIVWSQLWPRLSAPAAFAPPPGDGALRPEANGLLFGTEQQRWWLPLGALR